MKVMGSIKQIIRRHKIVDSIEHLLSKTYTHAYFWQTFFKIDLPISVATHITLIYLKLKHTKPTHLYCTNVLNRCLVILMAPAYN